MKYTEEVWVRIEELRDSGMTWDQIGNELGVSGNSVRSNYGYQRRTSPKGIPLDMEKFRASIPDDIYKEAGKEFEATRKRLEALTPAVQKAQLLATEHRKLTKKLLEKEIVLEDVVDAIRDATREINKTLKITPIASENTSNKKLTAEILFSDCQIGKLIKADDGEVFYDTQVALRRIGYYAEVVIKEIQKKIELGYQVEKLVIALLGDIIESDSKHETSYHGVDTSTSEQITNSISGIYRLFLAPLFNLGIETDVICIAGNHDWDRKGMSTTRAGRTMLTYPIYVALEEIAAAQGLNHVNFFIPAGSFAEYEIYGHHVIYEHGYNLNSINPEGIARLRHRRTDQIKKHVDYFRVGDKHQQFLLDNGKIVVNGAFFHDTKGLEYSGQLGFSSTPGQYVLFHTPRKDARNSIYNVMQVQMSHMK